jgi:small subunit ribosomal protein S2
MNKITMREMLEAGVHFGHRTRYWNPKMAPYIFGVRHKIHIINLDKSLPLYQEAVNFVSSVAAKNGKILFVGTKRSAQDIIREEAIRCGMPYVNHRWLGGMLTNYKTVRQSIKRLKDLEVMRDSKQFAGITKKEGLNLMRELTKLEGTLGGIKNMGGLPDAIFVVDVGNEDIVVSEANKLSIPVVGIVDTNRDPDNIDYIIPGNDDAVRAIRFYTKYIADAIIDARATLLAEKKEKSEKAEKEVKEVKKEVKPSKKLTIKKKAVEKEKEAKTKTVKITKVKKAEEKK